MGISVAFIRCFSDTILFSVSFQLALSFPIVRPIFFIIFEIKIILFRNCVPTDYSVLKVVPFDSLDLLDLLGALIFSLAVASLLLVGVGILLLCRLYTIVHLCHLLRHFFN